MFNPLYPFTEEVLNATVNRGCTWFVRNTYTGAFDHFDESIKGYFLITHFNDRSKAEAHYNSIAEDKNRFLYEWSNEEHKSKLLSAAKQPAGFKIYSSYFLPDFKKKITNNLKDKINRYMYRHTDWKPGKGETVNIDFYLQFGSLYITMRYAGQQVKVKFTDIENLQ